MNVFYYKSPIGMLEIRIKDNFITYLDIALKVGQSSQSNSYFEKVKNQLDEYFLGKRKVFNLDILPNGTDFQKKVWLELIKIPYGETKSYKEISEIIGKPQSQRAVGGACNKNHILLIIPCHRVISKNGDLRGFAGGIDIKKQLLELEKMNMIDN